MTFKVKDGVQVGSTLVLDSNGYLTTRLATARTIALSGDVSGSASFDGSASITITATVADDSHSHSNYLTGESDTLASVTGRGATTSVGVRLGGGTSNPAGTGFSHTLSGISTNRVVNFDGNGNGTPSVWWTSGSRAYGAIDAQDPGLTFWANNGSAWQKQITLNYGNVTIDTDIRSPIYYDSNNTAYYADPHSTSRFNVIELNGRSGDVAISMMHSGSDFPDGTLIVTNINAAVTYGDSFILEVTGKSYSTSPAFSLIVQGYIYSDTFINCSGTNMSGYGPSSLVILNYGGNLAFWIPRISYWNSFEARCRDAGGGSANRVTSIVNSTQPSSSKAVTVSMRNSVTYGINSNTSEIYATVLYDSNNTGFYLDPNSTSNLNITQTGSLNLGNSSTYKFSTGEWAGSAGWPGYTYTGGDHRFGFSSTSGKIDLWTDGIMYAIESHRSPIFYDTDNTGYYVDPNSTGTSLRLAGYGYFGLGIDGDGVVINHDQIWTPNGNFHIQYSGGGNIDMCNGGGYAWSRTSFRSPVFYDSDDTGYYLDARSASVLSGLKLNGVDNNASGNDYILWINKPNNNDWGVSITGQYDYNYMYDGAGSHSYGVRGLAAGSEYWRVGTDLMYHNSNIRAPIYYDNNDTGYYIDPNSTSNSALRMRGGALFGPNPTWGAYLYVGTDGRVGTSATVCVTNGNLHIDAQDGYDIYLANYNSRWPRTPGLYDNNDTGYYVDFNGTSRMNYVVPNRIKLVNNVNNEPRWDFSAYVVEAQHWYGNNSTQTMYLGESNVVYMPDIRPYIMYDRNDTGYYSDPASTNRLNFVNSNNHYIQPGYMLYSDHGSWQGEYNKIQWHAGHLYFQNAGGGYLAIFRRGDGGERGWIDYNGNATFSGNVTAYSDARLKENVETIPNAIGLVKRLRGVTFDWIESGEHSYGLIAQEVEAVIPELVMETENGTADGDQHNMVKSVDYSKLVSVLIQATKEQQEIIEKQDARIARLEALVQQLIGD